LRNKGWFQNEHDFALLLALDGSALFKRNSVQAWPIWGLVANLEPKERHASCLLITHYLPLIRYKEHNILLLAIWVGTGHPEMQRYLLPLMRQLHVLETVGVRISGTTIIIRTVVLTIVLDLKAKVNTQNNDITVTNLLHNTGAIAGIRGSMWHIWLLTVS
jgi:hypothetical protein